MPSHADVQNWYDDRYHTQGADAFRTREAYLDYLDQLEVEPGRVLLDVGCGSGYVLADGARRGLRVIGTDISAEAINLARITAPAAEFHVTPGETLPLADGTADYVVCLGVLEHFLDMDKGLDEMARVTRRSARFLIMVPNKDFFFWKLKRTAGTDQQQISEHLLSVAAWRQLFERHNFVVEQIAQDRWPMRRPRLLADAHPIRIIKRLVYKTLWALLPQAWCYQAIFIMHKTADETAV
ncbi:MAG: class I SAM-dependent methyltransferase [Candidatus Kerfeldbacteria bacterium]|nr:class I SAM-dependent methyltransferase [Candidatus Kerfeldbacteria bacterium]